jgi:hypothetical protein
VLGIVPGGWLRPFHDCPILPSFILSIKFVPLTKFALLREYGGAPAGGAVNPSLGLPCAALIDYLGFWNV